MIRAQAAIAVSSSLSTIILTSLRPAGSVIFMTMMPWEGIGEANPASIMWYSFAPLSRERRGETAVMTWHAEHGRAG